MGKLLTLLVVLPIAIDSLTALDSPGESNPNGILSDKLKDSLERIAQSSTPAKAARGYKALFDDVDSEQIRAIGCAAYDGVAVRGLWEEIRRTVGTDEELDAVPIDRLSLARLVGFVEGRLRVNVPEWWKETLCGARAYNRENLWFPRPMEEFYRSAGRGILAPNDTSLRYHGEEITIQVGSNAITFPSAVMEETMTSAQKKGAANCVSVCLGRDRCYLAIHSPLCVPYLLVCVDRTTGKRLWTTNVWAAGGLKYYTGPGFHRVTLIEVEGSRLLTFGAGMDSVYVEAFCASSGSNLYRFSTSY